LRSLATRDNRFDREHLAEEIEDLGKSEVTPCARRCGAS
jgi:hypothetical protein